MQNRISNTISVADRTLATPRDRRPGRLRRSAAALAAALLMMLGAGAVSAAPASAASGVSYCFRHTNGSPYTYNAYLQLWSGGRWVTVQDMGRSYSGCNFVTISGTWRNYPARMLAYTRVGSYIFAGATTHAPAGGGSYNLGTGWVNT